MTRKHLILAGAGVVTLLVLTAGASAYVTQRSLVEEEKPVAEKVVTKQQPHSEKITWNEPRQQPVQQKVVAPQQPACDDANIVGTLIGGVGGGAAGSQIGSGSGKTAATIGGTLGGAYLGNQFIPTRNVTCK